MKNLIEIQDKYIAAIVADAASWQMRHKAYKAAEREMKKLGMDDMSIVAAIHDAVDIVRLNQTSESFG